METLANVPQIIINGGAWYASVGTETSKGTKVFALSGDINNIGLVEVPMGTTLRTHDLRHRRRHPQKTQIQGGPAGRPLRGLHPRSTCWTHRWTTRRSPKSGAIMGSGGVIVMDENTCMVDMARFFMDFIQDESCGKCTPCREGTRRLLQILEKICAGHGRTRGHRRPGRALPTVINETALCGLGQTGPNPVLSTLRYFRDEFEAHIHEKRCPAKRCVDLLNFEVDPEICTTCGMCFRGLPGGGHRLEKKEVGPHRQGKMYQMPYLLR